MENKNYSFLYASTFENERSDFEQIRRFLGDSAEGWIVDMGAGAGRLMQMLKPSEKVMFVEPESTFLAVLKKKAVDKPNWKVLPGLSFKSGIESESASHIVYGLGAISEMSPLLSTLAEANRILKMSGKIYFSALNSGKHRTGSRGLDRARLLNSKDSISAESMYCPHLGPFEYRVDFIYREPGYQYKHVIEQTNPSLEVWEKILTSQGFEIENVFGSFNDASFSEQDSFVLVIEAKKTKSVGLLQSKEISGPSKNFEKTNPLERIYDFISPNYLKMRSPDRYGVPDWLFKKLEKYRGFHPYILDLGCGDGLVGEVLAKLDIKPCFLFGFDLSSQMLRVASQLQMYDGLIKIDLNQGFPEYKPRFCDLITLIGVTEFLDFPQEVLQQVAHALIVGGELFVTFEERLPGTEQNSISIEDKKILRHSYSRAEIETLLAKAGLDIEDFESAFGYLSPSTGETINYHYVSARKKLKS